MARVRAGKGSVDKGWLDKPRFKPRTIRVTSAKHSTATAMARGATVRSFSRVSSQPSAITASYNPLLRMHLLANANTLYSHLRTDINGFTES